MAGEGGAYVAEGEAVVRGALGEGGVEVVGGVVDGLALGLGQTEAGGAELVEAGVAEDDDPGGGALERMAEYTPSSLPGSVESTYARAVSMRETQELSDWVTQVVMTSANPASLPPTLIETRAVEALSGVS